MDPYRTAFAAAERARLVTRDDVPACVATPLQVFDTELSDQDGMLLRLEPHRRQLEEAVGGPFLVLFIS